MEGGNFIVPILSHLQDRPQQGHQTLLKNIQKPFNLNFIAIIPLHC